MSTDKQDTTEHCRDAQSQVSSANQVKVTADEVNKIMQAANISQPDADKLLAVSRGEFVEGISDPNDPKWVKGIQTRDSVNQNQQESEQDDQKAEQNSPDTQQNAPEGQQPEPAVQQEPEKVCNACGQTGGGNCPDCGAVMGDATYQETFNREQDEEPEIQTEAGETADIALTNLTWKQHLTIAAIQGLFANPAYCAVIDEIPGMADMIANNVMHIQEG